jgi:hypothetical protein
MTCIFTMINAVMSWIVVLGASNVSAAVAIIALAVTAVYNWKSFSLRRSEYCFNAAKHTIACLNTEIFSKHSDGSWLSISKGQLEKELESIAWFLTLHTFVDGIKDCYLLAAIETDRRQAIVKLISLLKSLSLSSEELDSLNDESIKGFAYLVRLIYAPNIKSALSQSWHFSATQKAGAIKSLMGTPDVDTKLPLKFLEKVFSYSFKQQS